MAISDITVVSWTTNVRTITWDFLVCKWKNVDVKDFLNVLSSLNISRELYVFSEEEIIDILWTALCFESWKLHWSCFRSANNEYYIQRLLLGTHTSGEPNHVMIAEVKLPLEDTPIDPRKYDDQRGGCCLFVFTSLNKLINKWIN